MEGVMQSIWHDRPKSKDGESGEIMFIARVELNNLSLSIPYIFIRLKSMTHSFQKLVTLTILSICLFSAAGQDCFEADPDTIYAVNDSMFFVEY